MTAPGGDVRAAAAASAIRVGECNSSNMRVSAHELRRGFHPTPDPAAIAETFEGCAATVDRLVAVVRDLQRGTAADELVERAAHSAVSAIQGLDDALSRRAIEALHAAGLKGTTRRLVDAIGAATHAAGVLERNVAGPRVGVPQTAVDPTAGRAT